MVRKPDATMQPAPQDNQLMAKDRVLSLEPQLRFEWRGQGGQSEIEEPDHSASLGDSITSSTRIRFSVHTGEKNGTEGGRHRSQVRSGALLGAVAELVGIEVGVVSGVFNLESSGVEAPDWRPRHDKQYHEA